MTEPATTPTYLFILCPPYSGSTLLWRLVATSAHASILPAEGQFLPEVRDEMRAAAWEPDRDVSWPRIKAVWDGYWDRTKPVLVEKSPPNAARAHEIAEHFHPVAFLVMVRNPYAHVEGLMRRNGWSAAKAAGFAAMTLGVQVDNARTLADATHFTYEDLVADPAGVLGRVRNLVPALDDMDASGEFAIHSVDGTVARGVVDLNARKIRRLSGRSVRAINRVLDEHGDAMTFWGYDREEPSVARSARAAGVRAADAVRGAARFSLRVIRGLRRRLRPRRR
ncbi:MAG: hypothetical protein DHS20C19_12470 [Acidimicrobiales bacterium]|nr:MAG: hypothetical protein DHS20C19_12470 [Acidimicrobiales bacterium]